MLTINEISKLSSISLGQLSHVLSVYGQLSYDEIEKRKDDITRLDYDSYMYLWKNLTPRISGTAENYRLYDRAN